MKRKQQPRIGWGALALVVCAFTCAYAGAQESWDAIYLGGAKIGWVHTFVEKVHNKGKLYLRVRVDMEQRTKRGNDVAVTKLMYGTIETPEGRVLRLDTLTDVSEGSRIRAHGDVIDGKMELIVEGAGDRQTLIIPWGPQVRGPYAAEQSMARAPLKAHESRQLEMFIPELNKIAQLTLKAVKVEPVVLGDGSRRDLLKVEQVILVDGKRRSEFESVLWVDEAGQVFKQEQDFFGGITYYRTTKEAALSPSGPLQFDMIRNTIIKVAPIPNPERIRQATYKLKLTGGDPAAVFPVDERQALRPEEGEGRALLVVRTQSPVDGKAEATDVAAEYKEPNSLVNSDDGAIQRAAARITRGTEDPWDKVGRINHWVFQSIRNKNFETAFAPASEVVQTLSGDCTEHAVLAAALLRAAGIPSRVAIGLVYVENPELRVKGFGFHMWDEVFINQRWVAIDPSFDQTAVDAVHIKLAHSSLSGVSPFETFIPLLRVAGKLEIEPVEIR